MVERVRSSALRSRSCLASLCPSPLPPQEGPDCLKEHFCLDDDRRGYVPCLCLCGNVRLTTDHNGHVKEHRFEAFRQDAPYLFDPTAPDLADFDMGMKTIECMKRAAGFGLWGVWSLYGSQIFADLIDVTFANAQHLYQKVKAAPDFEPIHNPESNIVAFDSSCCSTMAPSPPAKFNPQTGEIMNFEELAAHQEAN